MPGSGEGSTGRHPGRGSSYWLALLEVLRRKDEVDRASRRQEPQPPFSLEQESVNCQTGVPVYHLGSPPALPGRRANGRAARFELFA